MPDEDMVAESSSNVEQRPRSVQAKELSRNGNKEVILRGSPKTASSIKKNECTIVKHSVVKTHADV